MDGIFELIVESLKFLFPAYCANATPVLVGGGLPIDLGKNFVDGKPIFGKNKTFRGFIMGLAVGTLAGLMESFLFHYPIAFGFAISMGALLGDLAGAFLKRRIGIAPGKPLPIVDQIDFVIGALIFAIPLKMPSLELAIASLVITPPLHILTNFTSYKMGLKNTPW